MGLVTVEGVYLGGYVELDEAPRTVVGPTRVLVTFLPDGSEALTGTEVERREDGTGRDKALKRVLECMETGLGLDGRPYAAREEIYHDRINR